MFLNVEDGTADLQSAEAQEQIKNGDRNPLSPLAEMKLQEADKIMQKQMGSQMRWFQMVYIVFIAAWIYQIKMYMTHPCEILWQGGKILFSYKILEVFVKMSIVADNSCAFLCKILTSLTLKGGNMIQMLFNLWQKLRR
jgi:hypothetical protein